MAPPAQKDLLSGHIDTSKLRTQQELFTNYERNCYCSQCTVRWLALCCCRSIGWHLATRAFLEKSSVPIVVGRMLPIVVVARPTMGPTTPSSQDETIASRVHDIYDSSTGRRRRCGCRDPGGWDGDPGADQLWSRGLATHGGLGRIHRSLLSSVAKRCHLGPSWFGLLFCGRILSHSIQCSSGSSSFGMGSHGGCRRRLDDRGDQGH